MTARKFTEDTTYGLDKNKADSHMKKNSEWGAVAYLNQSIFGKYGNPNYSGSNKEIYQNKSEDYTTGMSNGTPGTMIYNEQIEYNVSETRTKTEYTKVEGTGTEVELELNNEMNLEDMPMTMVICLILQDFQTKQNQKINILINIYQWID